MFFSGPALHIGVKGIDFLQVPRGAWSFWHGGSLTGAPTGNSTVYASGETANRNVYHPLFTLTLGSLLMQFNPLVAYYIWLWIKLPLSIAGVAYFYWSFRDRAYVQFASCILLVNASIYLELAAGQFHFLLNLFLLVFLINVVKRNTTRSSIAYLLTLLIKPIGLLFLPALIMKRRWKVAAFGALLFVLCTLIFSKDPYYINNLQTNILHPSRLTDIQFFTLDALLRASIHWPGLVYSVLQYGVLTLILTLISFRRIHISKAIFLMMVYFLCFYMLVYEYDWSTLAYIIAVCIVCCPSFQTPFSLMATLLICLPSYFIVFNLFHYDVIHGVPSMLVWQVMVLSKLVPLFILCGSVLWSDIKPIVKQAKAFFRAMRKVNEHLGTFGEEQEEEHEPFILL
jgi:Protein of unknown function (DUF2029).